MYPGDGTVVARMRWEDGGGCTVWNGAAVVGVGPGRGGVGG